MSEMIFRDGKFIGIVSDEPIQAGDTVIRIDPSDYSEIKIEVGKVYQAEQLYDLDSFQKNAVIELKEIPGAWFTKRFKKILTVADLEKRNEKTS